MLYEGYKLKKLRFLLFITKCLSHKDSIKILLFGNEPKKLRDVIFHMENQLIQILHPSDNV